MNHLALITKTTSLIAAGDIVGAESALADLADTEGDNALMVVLDQLAPKDVLAVMREYDDSKASVVNPLVDAKGLVDVPMWRHALINVPHPLLTPPAQSPPWRA